MVAAEFASLHAMQLQGRVGAMRDGLRILVGAGLTALAAVIAHGPMGMGAAFMAQLQERARVTLASRGLGNVNVDFPDSPYARVAHLSGDATPVQQTDAINLMRGLWGSAGAVWDGERAAIAEAGANAPPPANAGNAAEPAPALPIAAPTPGATPGAAPAPAPAAQPSFAPAARPGACQSRVDAALRGRVMRFRSGSAWLNPQSRAIIADMAAALRACSGYALVVGGHTDASGSEAVNAAMSQERANRVREGLIAQGVPANAVTARGYGSARPIAPGRAADPANRRISFTVTGGGA